MASGGEGGSICSATRGVGLRGKAIAPQCVEDLRARRLKRVVGVGEASGGAGGVWGELWTKKL